ncbi:MAG: peptidase M23 [Ignavibacteriae bacterium HGW-Ignavibacteriae-3]|nr:MAG: peptidase M23 [Ignavibacteriae bacterium HGW-Ignavibacteriae-3]
MQNKFLIFTRLLLIISITLISISCKKDEPVVQKEAVKPNQFGLFVENLIEVKDTIESGQTLSDILMPHQVSLVKIHELEKAAKNIFPLRNFRADDELHIYASWDSVETVKYFVYTWRNNPVDYVVFDLRDSINIYKKSKPVTITQLEVSGKITNSLSKTLNDKNIPNALSERMEDVYAWQIDFFRLQPTDSFKVIYEQLHVEGEPAGVGKILSANFITGKENHYAFYFDKEKGEQYFDEKGNSLKRLFLKAPLKYSRISSKFSMSRYHPILHRSKAHLGTDYAAPAGTPIMTVGTGVVLEAAYTSGNGNYVKIRHNATYTTQYLHMSRIAKGIRRGVSVTQGQIIGYVGSTGLATGPHVCFRFWKNGRQVNPLREKYQSSGPVSRANKNEFMSEMNEWMKKLEPVESASVTP